MRKRSKEMNKSLSLLSDRQGFNICTISDNHDFHTKNLTDSLPSPNAVAYGGHHLTWRTFALRLGLDLLDARSTPIHQVHISQWRQGSLYVQVKDIIKQPLWSESQSVS